MKQNTPIGAGQPIRAVGIPWFLESDFAQIKATMEDAQKLHATWVEWHGAAQQTEKTYQSQGFLVVRAVLAPDEFAAWCRSSGHRLDAKGRSQYAGWIAVKKHGQAH